MTRLGILTPGQAIQLARLHASLTQAELADKLGVSKRSIQEWESGRVDATRHIKRIEEATEKPAGWITDRVDPAERLSDIWRDVQEIKALLEERLPPP